MDFRENFVMGIYIPLTATGGVGVAGGRDARAALTGRTAAKPRTARVATTSLRGDEFFMTGQS